MMEVGLTERVVMATRRADIADWIALSANSDVECRRDAVHALCPCQVRADVPEVWNRILELAEDPDADIRRLVVHALCDGSPIRYRAAVLNALEKLAQDSEQRVRRRARKALAMHRSTGTVNNF